MNRSGSAGRKSRHRKHASVPQQEGHVWRSLDLLKNIQGSSQGEDDTISGPLTQHLQLLTTCAQERQVSLRAALGFVVSSIFFGQCLR